ncbi:MAG: PBSX family phage terminase large subunit [Massiliimalia sp.]|jgi:PBSX family phage terminase large subunit
MNIREFSPKQYTVISWWCKGSPYHQKDAIICDGAVRSGKSSCMSLSFLLWSMASFENAAFGLCAKTVTSLRRNLLEPLKEMMTQLGFRYEEKVSKNYLDIWAGERCNRFYLFWGKDEGSAALIQGITLSGVLLDEVVLMPRSFVEQAIARCSASGSRIWFNCNPSYPGHWFYQEWIQKAEQKNTLYLHFTMEDNPSLSEAIRRRYESLYSGTFYDRFVLGKWVNASGLVYPMFSQAKHVVSHRPEGEKWYISCDYGTVNPTSMGLWTEENGVWVRVSEYYYDSRKEHRQKTDEEYYRELELLADGHPITAVIADPSAASFMECIRRHGKFAVIPAKNDVLTGIRKVSDQLQQGTLKFHQSCRDTLREFSQYVWEDGEKGDIPKKEHDHAMDDIRYFVNTVLGQEDGFFVLSAERRT